MSPSTRCAKPPKASTPAVLKVVKPEVLGTVGPTAFLMVQKEAIALGRLNERVPSTPFVVRFIDTGTVVLKGPKQVELPWLALEYVQGGTEGTTLEQRVGYSVKNTRFAFDPTRAAHTIECLADGLAAIHEVGVVHRDLTPGNILCCGFGATEVPKIADFGIARPTGIKATFGSVFLGTPGYAAPEQSFASEGEIGPSTDVFSFACLTFFALTGEQYFDTGNFAQALLMVRETKRRSLLEATPLRPELRDNPGACRAIDQVLAHATAQNPTERSPDARIFASSLLPLLRNSGSPRSQRASDRLVASIAARPVSQAFSQWKWTVRHPPGHDRLIRSVAWDGDGHCLAVTTEGLHFWNGTSWQLARAGAFDPDAGLRSASLVRPGQWLLGGDSGLLALLGSDGQCRVIHGPADVDFALASGDPSDLAVVVAERPNASPLLYSVAADRFFRPTALEVGANHRVARPSGRFALARRWPNDAGNRLCSDLFGAQFRNDVPAHSRHRRAHELRRATPTADSASRWVAAARPVRFDGRHGRPSLIGGAPGSRLRRDGRSGARLGRRCRPPLVTGGRHRRRMDDRVARRDVARAVRQCSRGGRGRHGGDGGRRRPRRARRIKTSFFGGGSPDPRKRTICKVMLDHSPRREPSAANRGDPTDAWPTILRKTAA